jgi:hypothetical protein
MHIFYTVVARGEAITTQGLGLASHQPRFCFADSILFASTTVFNRTPSSARITCGNT